MTLREDALREPGRPEAQTKALIYIGDQLAHLTAAIEHATVMQHQPPTQHSGPLKTEPEYEPPKRTPKKTTITTDPEGDEEKGRSK